MQIGVILIHGIGRERREWADDTIRRLRALTHERVRTLLPGRAVPPPDDLLIVASAYWKDILHERQAAFKRILDTAHGQLRLRGARWRKLLGWLEWLVRYFERIFVSEFVSDIIGYQHPETRTAVHAAIGRTLKEMAQQLPPDTGKVPLTVIAHSLGTVITSDYIWDQTKQRGAGRGFHDRWMLENLFTVGSPMALFSLRFGGPEAFSKPIVMETARGRWMNLFDRDDPVGMPLKPLNEAYDRAVFKDVDVQAGFYLWSHLRYFTHSKVLELISHKLALDWIASNTQLSGEQLAALDTAYERALA